MLSELCRGVGVVQGRKIVVVPEGSSGECSPEQTHTAGPGSWPSRPTPLKAHQNATSGPLTYKQKWKYAKILTEGKKFPIRPLGIPRSQTPESTRRERAYNDAKFSALWSKYMSTSESSSASSSLASSLDSSSVSFDDWQLEESNDEWDYHNIQGRRFYLPPLQQQAWANEKHVSPREIRAHKTYTTRKGALLLYAEDLALTASDGTGKNRSLEAEDSSYFNSISDLRNAVLSYGSSNARPQPLPPTAEHSPSSSVYLGFVHNKRAAGPYRTVRPGFSAKRYLANWSRSWDDSILNYLRSEGHIWDKNLFQQNVLAPNLYRRINDDLSLIPMPYRVTRNMLVSPGEFESLEFYRIRPDSAHSGHALTLDEIFDRLWGYSEEGYEADIGEGNADDENGDRRPRKKRKSAAAAGKPFNVTGSIAMIVRDMEQKPHAVQYETLEPDQQREVLQRLLLQSALHQQQHLRMMREMKEEEEEAGEGEQRKAGEEAKMGQEGASLVPKKKGGDSNRTQHGSLIIPDAREVDMEHAIANLITSNSTNILGGSTAFTDQTILEMYKASKLNAMMPVPPPPPSASPSQWPHGATRPAKSNLRSTYPSSLRGGGQPLPPIQNSLEGGLGGGDSLWPIPPPKPVGAPVIMMEPPTPQHPRLSGTIRGSRLSQGWSSRGKTATSASYESSSETNIWRADIDEDNLLRQAEAEEAEQERAASDQEVWTQGGRSSQKGSLHKTTSKHSVHSNASKASSESGPALTINSHLSQSMENLAQGANEQSSRFPSGRTLPSRLRESMRSYKGSAKSDAGSLLLAAPGDDGSTGFVVTGSRKGSNAPSVASEPADVPTPASTPQVPDQPTVEKWGEPEARGEVRSETKEVTEVTSMTEGDGKGEVVEEKAQPLVKDTKSDAAAIRSDVGSRADLAASTDDGHSVITDEFPSSVDGADKKEDDGQTGVTDEGKGVKLGQGVIELPQPELPGPGSIRSDRMSERKSQPRSKKSSTQGSVKSESVHSVIVFWLFTYIQYQGDLDIMQSFQNFSYQRAHQRRQSSQVSRASDDELLSDQEQEGVWPGQMDQSQAASQKAGSVASQQEDQRAEVNSRKGDSMAGSESEVDVELAEDRAAEESGLGGVVGGGGGGGGGDGKASSQLSSRLEPPSAAESMRSRPATVESQLEQLVEAASVVVEQILQRPRSGRDLASDAQMAAELWSEKLGELFTDDREEPDRVRSAPHRRRRNSLDAASVTSSMLNEEEDRSGQRATPMSSKRIRKVRRLHSAEAAISLLRHLLKAAPPANDDVESLSSNDLESLISRVAEENSNVKIGQDVTDMMENQEPIDSKSIVVIEDISERKIFLESSHASTDFSTDNDTDGDAAAEEEKEEIEEVPAPEEEIKTEREFIVRSRASVMEEEAAGISDGGPTEGTGAMQLAVLSPRPPASALSQAPSVVVETPKGAASAQGEGKDADGGTSLGLGVTNIGVAEKAEPEKQPPLVRLPTNEQESPPVEDSDSKLNDELAKIVQETGLLEKKGPKSKKGSTKGSTKSSKSNKSSKKSANGKEADDAPDAEEKDAFIVGIPKESKADIMLYKPMTPEPKKEEPKPPPKEKKKIQKKTKKAQAPKPEKPKKPKKKPKSESSKSSKDGLEEEEDAKSKASSEKKEEEEKEEEGQKEESEKDKGEEQPPEKEEEEEEEEEEAERQSPESPEFIFIHDEFSESEDEPVCIPPEPPEPEIQLEPTVSAVPSEDMTSEFTDFTEDSTSQGPNSISRSQAKAFKRAAEAEKRRVAVEKKRREREEAKRKAQEEAERKERIQLEFEEEKRRKEAEARERAEREALERQKQAKEEEERQRQAALAAERERRQQAEYKRKMEEMARKKKEEEAKKKAEEEVRRKEEEERQRLEAERLAAMEEAERLEYEKRRQAEELEAARIAEEERIRREMEEKIAQAQAEKLALEMARRQKELEARLQFNKELHSEANVFAHSQEMTRAFTWSYFELLDYLGIEIPDSLKEHYKEIAGGAEDS
ncbi:uncharacterized protein [Diadema setosum]|uniref:uncharacterized protein n=1 Tax=Diadema setosum TaxID=31175 RepID=UPI003B3AA3B9